MVRRRNGRFLTIFIILQRLAMTFRIGFYRVFSILGRTMALKDIWQQDRLDRQAQQVERQQAVAETRVANRADLDQMAIETRETLSTVLPELKVQNEARRLRKNATKPDSKSKCRNAAHRFRTF